MAGTWSFSKFKSKAVLHFTKKKKKICTAKHGGWQTCILGKAGRVRIPNTFIPNQ